VYTISFRSLALAGGLFAASCALLAAPVRAAVEFCPARIGATHAFDASRAGILAFSIDAQSARTVSGNAVIEGKNGWYTFPFKSVTLLPDEGTYKTSYTAFTRTAYRSKPLYLQLPADESVVRMWVRDAAATGDGSFGWEKRGDVQCTPPAFGVDNKQRNASLLAKRTNPSQDLSLPPGADDALVVPQPIDPPAGFTACAQPFAAATVTHAVSPEFPRGSVIVAPITTFVEVAVKADGSLEDAWIYQSSGSTHADLAALAAAKASSYRAGTALCAPAPGLYTFRATFSPY